MILVYHVLQPILTPANAAEYIVALLTQDTCQVQRIASILLDIMLRMQKYTMQAALCIDGYLVLI